MSVKGHAGQAPIGHDLICAAISILTHTAAQIVQTMNENGRLARPPTVRLGRGDAQISCQSDSDEYYDEAYKAYTVIQTGCSLLAANYPEYVTLKMFDKA